MVDVNNIVNEVMNFQFEFTSPMFIDLEETNIGVAIIRGTLLAEGISKNGNLYTFDQLQHIAETAEGVPIYYGTTTKLNPNTGILTDNMHNNLGENIVGKIMKTWVDAVDRKIKFIAQLVANANFPNLIEQVKKGWGVSIGGKGTARFIVDSLKRVVTKIIGLTVNHVQLLSPDTSRGQEQAQIEEINRDVQESMMFHNLPKAKIDITEIHIGEGTSVNFDIDI